MTPGGGHAPVFRGCRGVHSTKVKNTLKIREKTLHFFPFRRPGGTSLGRHLGPALNFLLFRRPSGASLGRQLGPSPHFLPFQRPGGTSLGRHLGPAGRHVTGQVFPRFLERLIDFQLDWMRFT